MKWCLCLVVCLLCRMLLTQFLFSLKFLLLILFRVRFTHLFVRTVSGAGAGTRAPLGQRDAPAEAAPPQWADGIIVGVIRPHGRRILATVLLNAEAGVHACSIVIMGATTEHWVGLLACGMRLCEVERRREEQLRRRGRGAEEQPPLIPITSTDSARQAAARWVERCRAHSGRRRDARPEGATQSRNRPKRARGDGEHAAGAPTAKRRAPMRGSSMTAKEPPSQ